MNLLDTIVNVDCILGMSQIEDESIDLLLTDPPYNVSKKSNFHTMGRVGVDFGDWDRGFNQKDWLYIACDKIKKGGSAIIFNDYKNIGDMVNVLEEKGMVVKELIVWNKSNPMPRNRDRLYVTSIEVAIWATKSKKWTFNRQKETYENAIFKMPIVNHKKRIHPTQKPVELISELIKIHSNENDIILDCFTGAGTTALAAIKNNRRFIGFEIDKNYYELSLEKINEQLNRNSGQMNEV